MFSTRALVHSDQAQLWHWLHLALWDPPPAGLRPIEVLQTPGVRIYAENWGAQAGRDIGVVGLWQASPSETPQAVGACWARCLAPQLGLAYIDEYTPQLGIALEPGFQKRGFGKILMQNCLQAAQQAGYPQVSLTVHPENPARFMYAACGFHYVETRNHYHLMVARF